MTAGGLPFSEFANKLRLLPAFKTIWEDVLRIDGRWDPDNVAMIATHEALLMTRAGKGTYKGLPEHRDNNKLKVGGNFVKEISFLQGQLLLHPPPKAFTRCGVLASYIPLSPSSYHNQLISLCTRYGQCENGCVARSALERPRCGNVLGGDCLPLREARKLSEDDLLSFVRKSVAPYLRQSMSKKPDQATLRKSRATFMRDLVERVGNPVRTEATLKSAIARKG
eukprot:4858762-Pyramimonas_sp.AAC.1